MTRGEFEGDGRQFRHLLPAGRAVGEVVVERRLLVRRQGVQDVRADELVLVLGVHDLASRHLRSCRSPERIRDFTVPAGVARQAATSRYVMPW